MDDKLEYEQKFARFLLLVEDVSGRKVPDLFKNSAALDLLFVQYNDQAHMIYKSILPLLADDFLNAATLKELCYAVVERQDPARMEKFLKLAAYFALFYEQFLHKHLPEPQCQALTSTLQSQTKESQTKLTEILQQYRLKQQPPQQQSPKDEPSKSSLSESHCPMPSPPQQQSDPQP